MLRLFVLAGAALASLVLAACGGDETDALSESPVVGDATPPAELVETWPEKRCDVRIGMTREEAYAVMGPPTSEGDEGASWAAYQWMFNLFVGSDGRVRQLDVNESMLSEADRARIDCESTRT